MSELVIEFTHYSGKNEENDRVIKLPAKYAVCPTCNGKGSHTNPAIDGNGLTADDFDRLGGDDFREDYMSGVYDVPCYECKGLRVILVPDEGRCFPEDLAAYDKSLRDIEEWKQEQIREVEIDHGPQWTW